MTDCVLSGSGRWHLGKTLRKRWEAINGPLPDGMQLNHTCDVKNCINPDHAYVGTQLENMRDRKARRGEWKGGLKRGDTCPHGHDWTTDNTIVGRDGRWRCRACKNALGREYMRRKRAAA